MEILIILFLIFLNGIFAMAEIAIVSSRKSKLQEHANEGSKRARAALELTKSPSRFLSTLQIGITVIGVFAGAFGGATVAQSFSLVLQKIGIPPIFSGPVAFTIVVSCIAFLSLLGELIPKRLALYMPERIAIIFARPVTILSQVSRPIVNFLSSITDWILRIFRIDGHEKSIITDEEVRILLREGTQTGAFEVAEKDIVERTLKLSDKNVSALMVPRREIIWLDTNSSFMLIKKKITKHPHAYFPICEGSLDKVVGVIHTESFLIDFLREGKIQIEKVVEKPLFVPESMDGLKLLEMFKESGIHMALVTDEYGTTQGLVSLADILEAIVGDIPAHRETRDEEIIKGEDGKFYIDGILSIDKFKDFFKIKRLPGERSGSYHTVGGFVMKRLSKIPRVGDTCIFGNIKIEVVDMDGNRVDKVCVYHMQKKKQKEQD